MSNPTRIPECDCCGERRPCVTGPFWSVCCTETFACHVCLGRDECDECEDECPACGKTAELSDATTHGIQFFAPLCDACRAAVVNASRGPQNADEARGDA